MGEKSIINFEHFTYKKLLQKSKELRQELLLTQLEIDTYKLLQKYLIEENAEEVHTHNTAVLNTILNIVKEVY